MPSAPTQEVLSDVLVIRASAEMARIVATSMNATRPMSPSITAVHLPLALTPKEASNVLAWTRTTVTASIVPSTT